MDIKKLLATRAIIGKICVMAGIIAFVSIFDVLVSSYRTPENTHDVVRGSSVDINGRLYGSAKGVADLEYSASNPDVRINFDQKLYSGFWFGEGMWRGTIAVPESIGSGSYKISLKYPGVQNLKQKDVKKFEKLSNYTINVFDDEKAMREASYSMIKRMTNVSPWVTFAVFFPIILVGAIINYKMSSILEILMAEIGQAEIYRINRVDKGFEVYFGLGKKHGLNNGDIVNLLSDKGDYIAKLEVENAGYENSTALVGVYREVKPGFFVSRVHNA